MEKLSHETLRPKRLKILGLLEIVILLLILKLRVEFCSTNQLCIYVEENVGTTTGKEEFIMVLTFMFLALMVPVFIALKPEDSRL